MSAVSLQTYSKPITTTAHRLIEELPHTIAASPEFNLILWDGEDNVAYIARCLTKIVMENVERSPIKGDQQLTVALRIMRILIEAQSTSPLKAAMLRYVDEGGAMAAIELAVAASKGALSINKVAKAASGCMGPCKALLAKCCGGRSR